MSRGAELVAAAVKVWNVAQRDTGQSGVCVRLLLSLYNGNRFQFALTDFRRLDGDLRRAAFDLIGADASHGMPCEVHEFLNQVTGRRDFGQRFEHLAHNWRLPGKCPKKFLDVVEPKFLFLKEPDAPRQPVPSALQATPDVAARPWASPI